MTQDLSTLSHIMARTIWGEARGCGAAGMSHVAMVIMNRAAHPRWWGHDIPSVCLAGWQFSCWNPADPNRQACIAVTTFDGSFAIACRIEAQAQAGSLTDETGGADSYFAIGSPQPVWVKGATHTYSDGWHSFWRVELPAPAAQPSYPDFSAEDLNAEELAKLKDDE